MRLLSSLVVALVCLGGSSRAAAFHKSGSFERSSNVGGGGGVFFTGAERWKRYDCSICHTDSIGTVSIDLSSSPPELFTEGTWQPGQAYEIVVSLVGERKGLQSASNINTFVAEVSDASGKRFSGFRFDPDELSTWSDGRIIGALDRPSRTQWSFEFQTPSRGAGALSFHVALVDGDGANSLLPASNSTNDEVAIAHSVWCEAGTKCVKPESTAGGAAGCSTGQGESAGWIYVILQLLWARLRCPSVATKRIQVLQGASPIWRSYFDP